MNISLKILAFLFAVFLLILVHEYGHFLVARRFKVKILKFSIGFGKALFTWHGKHPDKNEYVIAAIPLGGYVKMLDTREMNVPEKKLSLAFDKKPIYQRLLIILTGPVTNLLLAFIALWLMFGIGFELPKPIIGKILPNSIAAHAGLKADTEIMRVDHKPITDWQSIMLALFSRLGDKDTLRLAAKSLMQVPASAKTYTLNLLNWQSNNIQPDPLQELGIIPYHPAIPTIIGEIQKRSPAEQAGLQAQDKILSIDGNKFTDWTDLIEYIKNKPKQTLNIAIERKINSTHTRYLNLQATTNWKFGERWKKIGYLGIQSLPVVSQKDKLQLQHYSWLNASLPAYQQMQSFIIFNSIIIGKLITGKISLHVLGGPISIFQSAGEALLQGKLVYLGFIAILSLMLGFINLIPIPGLDGGHILMLGIEKLRGKPLSITTQAVILRIGMMLLILLMIQATINDLARIM